MSKTVKLLITAIILNIALAFFDAFVLMFIWNRFVPAATGGLFPVVNYWITFGIMLLVDIITLKLSKAKSENTEVPEMIGYAIGKMIIEGAFIGIAALVSLGI